MLCKVLESTRGAWLKPYSDKSRFLTSLGHNIGCEEAVTAEENVSVTNEWPTPLDQRQLKDFLWLVPCYRRFVWGFSCTAPPFQLLQKSQGLLLP